MSSATEISQMQILRRAAVRATLAPSVHNTQPWRFVLSDDALEVWADRRRQLQALDPTGRQLIISCGCAVFNARVVIAAAGGEAQVATFPDVAQPDLIAHIVAGPRWGVKAQALATLDPLLELRRTNRRRFADEPVPEDVTATLVRAATAEGAELFVIREPAHRHRVAELSRQADAIENANPSYQAEMRAWTTDNPRRGDGVQAMTVPNAGGPDDRERDVDDMPIRGFDSRGMGWLPTATNSSRDQCLLLIGSATDEPHGWLRTGQALERLLLEVTRHGYAASPLTQAVEVPATRATLRSELNLAMYPHVLLRVGRAPATPATRRRRLVDTITERHP